MTIHYYDPQALNIFYSKFTNLRQCPGWYVTPMITFPKHLTKRFKNTSFILEHFNVMNCEQRFFGSPANLFLGLFAFGRVLGLF